MLLERLCKLTPAVHLMKGHVHVTSLFFKNCLLWLALQIVVLGRAAISLIIHITTYCTQVHVCHQYPTRPEDTQTHILSDTVSASILKTKTHVYICSLQIYPLMIDYWMVSIINLIFISKDRKYSAAKAQRKWMKAIVSYFDDLFRVQSFC